VQETQTCGKSVWFVGMGRVPTQRQCQERAEETKQGGERAAGEEPGRKPRPLDSFSCTCGGEGLDHKTSCPRCLAIYRRRKAGRLSHNGLVEVDPQSLHLRRPYRYALHGNAINAANSPCRPRDLLCLNSPSATVFR
jgi:hypothetical protein